ncbi:hypothetical protein [Riemerella anatipestifer]|uniref:hypothetical protein n=1 Tax=Riemerella anatipestifer TaxID=34085 RepID=UPI0021A9E068|nr:hypothetical protein [Riemerella anatipestifer]MDY3521497.1 hypothetical protein [Riemerella anatipestifer]MDY3533627.1 hypothetical protein [Riemerella anatipestifer]MDY3536032.1 hypothetical protein [Riemerella anatipestifer]
MRFKEEEPKGKQSSAFFPSLKPFIIVYQKINSMEYPISLDTALSIVGSLKVKTMKEKSNTHNEDERKILDDKIRMYLQEERILYGTDEYNKMSVMDKVVNYYSPLIKQLNGLT